MENEFTAIQDIDDDVLLQIYIVTSMAMCTFSLFWGFYKEFT